jgi:hypothetical protein
MECSEVYLFIYRGILVKKFMLWFSEPCMIPPLMILKKNLFHTADEEIAGIHKICKERGRGISHTLIKKIYFPCQVITGDICGPINYKTI